MPRFSSLLFSALLLWSASAYAQPPKDLYIEDILKDAQATQKTVIIENANILRRTTISSREAPRYETAALEFRNCRFTDLMSVDNLTARSIIFRDCTINSVVFEDVKADTLHFFDSQVNDLAISTLFLEESTYHSIVGSLRMYGSDIRSFSSLLSSFDDVSIRSGNITIDRSKAADLFITGNGSGDLTITDSKIDRLETFGAFGDLTVTSTNFTGGFNLEDVNISGLMKITNSSFSRYITFGEVAVPTENIELPFDQLADGKLRTMSTRFVYDPDLGGMLTLSDYITRDSLMLSTLTGTTGYSSVDSAYFHSSLDEQLIYHYQRLFNSYRVRGDIESANACYVELKDLERSRLRFRHKEHPSFKSFFRLQLANLLKVYTEHGTDPAKAIVMSVWVMLIFAVFYFFFPSDWDATSKTRMLQNYRDFIEKNEKGYVKPFLFLVGGFLLSFINALTLSLNSFTTLGFGNIPTHGIARYVCVIQGFIGWFLLSIFTVALINQALF